MKLKHRLKTIFSDKVMLVPLSVEEADFFYRLYTDRRVIAQYEEAAILGGERPEVFTQRIISACNNIWTIRSSEKPEEAIGDCALHGYNSSDRSIEIGGSLFPEYWGQGYMEAAFSLVIVFAVETYSVAKVIAKTAPGNKRALRFAEKFGFVLSNNNTLLLNL